MYPLLRTDLIYQFVQPLVWKFRKSASLERPRRIQTSATQVSLDVLHEEGEELEQSVAYPNFANVGICTC